MQVLVLSSRGQVPPPGSEPELSQVGKEIDPANPGWPGRLAKLPQPLKKLPRLAKGGQALRDEIDRLRPTIDAGGYIPGCDHGIPPDVSWPNFVETCRLLAEATGWL